MKYGQLSERYRKYFKHNPRHYAVTREGVRWRTICGELVPTNQRAMDPLFVDCASCKAALEEEIDNMSDIQTVYDSIIASADAHADPRGPYARGLRAAADRLRRLLPAPEPNPAQDTLEGLNAPPEPTSAAVSEAKRRFRPPVGTFREPGKE